jgi:hypothetical protein
MQDKLEIGIVSGYFNHVGVAAIALLVPLSVGNRIRIKGLNTGLEFDVEEI